MGKGLQLVLGMSLAILCLVVVPATAQDAPAKPKIASEILLPPSTKAWFSIPDYSELKSNFTETEFGRLTKDEKFKPFIDSMSEQARSWMNNQNVRLGVKVEDIQAVRSGEICFAGVLRDTAGEQAARGSHGMVLLVDVSKTEEKARELLKKVDADFLGRNAQRGQVEVNGIAVTKWTVQRPKKKIKIRSTFHVIAGGWMIASDNETVLREIVRRAVDITSVKPSEMLATQVSFRAVVEKTNVKGVESNFRWYIDPFGYIELAQAIEREDQSTRKRENDWARILKEEGFGAMRGVGGQVSFLTGDHEMLHRTFLYAPRAGAKANQKRFFGLFDFENKYSHNLVPAEWLPKDVSSYFAATWNMTGALESIGGVIDSFMKEQGSFKNILKDLKTDMNVDVPELVASFDNQVVVVSAVARPIGPESEQMAICVPIKDGKTGTLEVFKRALGGPGSYKLRKFNGIEVLLVEAEEVEVDDAELGGLFLDPDEAEEEGEDDEEEEEFQLFEKKYFAVANNYLIVCNNEDFLKQILSKKTKKGFAKSPDYTQVQVALEKIVDPKKVSFRQFGRVDRSLEANYEMLRQGKMGSSKTMLARIVNQIMTAPGKESAPGGPAPRPQKLDGSKLPSDYNKLVAPYFGPMGWVFETHDDGWRLTGCMLKKNANELVRKPETTAATR